MIILTPEQIENIAGELDAGMICFLNKITCEVKTFLNEDNYPDAALEFPDKEMKEVYKNIGNFITFEPMDSTESFETMVDFVDSIEDEKLKEKLEYVLNGPNPFRKFKNKLLYYDDARKDWFNFKKQAYIELVSNQLEAYNFRSSGDNSYIFNDIVK